MRPAMNELAERDAASGSTGGGEEKATGFYGLIVFSALAVALLAIVMYTPLGRYFQTENIKALAESLGFWGPTAVVSAAIITPVLLLPRWPVAFVGGLLYGVFWGTALATIGSSLGSLLHFILARNLLARTCEKLAARHKFVSQFVSAGRSFTAIFLLRAFPFTSCAVTNLLAGAMRVRMLTFFVATVLGMIPSSLMYAAWGKLLKKPSAWNYALAITALLVLVAGTLVARRKMNSWLDWLNRKRRQAKGV
ncbi:MAG: hypothetical protein C0404_10730 [Verrucomicrobia bacterium]|nr:hypothetical protein [Verrucomicrobiota bacterium]